MKCIPIEEGFAIYQFDPAPGRGFGINIAVLTEGREALLIDTGCEPEMAELAAQLGSEGLRVREVIISHFHDDHMRGLLALEGVQVWGGARFRETLDLWAPRAEHARFEPTRAVSAPTHVSHGRFRLELIPFPGHSACGLLTRVNGRHLLVADEIMCSNGGEPLLPSVSPGPRRRHLESLERLEGWLDDDFIPAHGAPLRNRHAREQDLRDRRSYLTALLDGEPAITVAAATAGCSRPFLFPQWHEHNLAALV